MRLANNAKTILKTDIVSSSNSFLVKDGEGALFVYEGDTQPFIVFVEEIENGQVVKREAMEVKRNGDTFYILNRAVEEVVSNDTADPKVREAKQFNFTANKTQISLYIGETNVNEVNETTDYKNAIKAGEIKLNNGVDTVSIKKDDGSKGKIETDIEGDTIINGNITTSGTITAGSFVGNGRGLTNVPSQSFIFGDGSDGDLIITSGITNLNLNQVYQFSSINITSGTTLSTTDTLGNMYIKCKGDCQIDGDIDLNEKNWIKYFSMVFGDCYGGKGGDGGGSRHGGEIGQSVYGAGGGGAGGGTMGSTGGNGGNGINNINSGLGIGGNGGCNDSIGKGGDANGQDGNNGSNPDCSSTNNGYDGGYSAGGGGASYYENSGSDKAFSGGGGGGGAGGGGLLLYTKNFTLNGNISAKGGNGGNGGNGRETNGNACAGGGGGGAGGGGFVNIVYTTINNNGNIDILKGNKGSGGSGDAHGDDGQDGTDGIFYLKDINKVF